MLIEQYKIKISGTDITCDGTLFSDYLDARTISQGYSEDRGRPEFISFYNNLYSNGLSDSNGYPQNLKKVSLINGSLTGSKKYKIEDYSAYYPNPGSQTLKIKGFAKGPWDWGTIHTVTLENYAMSYYGNEHKISYYKQKEFFGWDTTDAYLTNINSRGVLDNVPGGFFGANAEVAKSIIDQNPYTEFTYGSAGANGSWFDWSWGITVDYWGTPVLKPASSFIPTVSALGFVNPDFSWKDPVGNRNLICSEEIPFDSYYGEEVNTGHISFTESSYNWLEGWLDELDPEPPIYLEAELLGDDVICPSLIKTYTIDVPDNCIGPVNWTVSPNLNIVSQDNTNISVIQNTENTENAGFIDISIPSANFDSTKSVWVGVPNNDNLSIQKIGFYDVYAHEWTKLKANYPIFMYENNDPLDGLLTFEWQITNSQIRNYDDSAFKDIKPFNPGELTIGVKAVNICGCSNWTYRLFDVLSSGNPSGTIMTPR